VRGCRAVKKAEHFFSVKEEEEISQQKEEEHFPPCDAQTCASERKRQTWP